MMYGKTTYNQLSRFVKNEMPRQLIFDDVQRKREFSGYSGYNYGQSFGERQSYSDRRSESFSEFRRPVEIAPKKREKAGAAEYGIEKFAPGTRVSHDMFGPGQVLSSRDMGGDVLYEVKFDNGQIKKLMATFAKLKKL